ncbi:hypothetical protein V6N12_067699 [Hibiscus sabdariffa]|uniref:Uncharacterized protein n=1 Tax=Hibiscus sabdariffa TaxID=183260 RepID=A0ABR2B7S8_9ROSI
MVERFLSMREYGCFSEWLKRSQCSVQGCCAIYRKKPICAPYCGGLRDNQRKRGRAFVTDEYESEESDDEGPRCPQCAYRHTSPLAP